MDLRINFENLKKKIKIDSQNHNQKIKIILFIIY